MGVLREAGDTIPVVHAVRGRAIEIGTVPSARRLHLAVPRGVRVFVVHGLCIDEGTLLFVTAICFYFIDFPYKIE
jgi:hypothetical protein